MQISVLNKQTSPLRNAQLQQIGIRITSKPLLPQEASETGTAEGEGLNPIINAVHLRRFASAPVPVGQAKSYTDIAVPQDIHLDSLLQALHQVEANFNQENALRLHADTQQWVKDITQQMNLPEDSHYGLSLKGSFGEIELDLEQLEPRHIQTFFANLLAGFNAEDLRQHYEKIGNHGHISAGFSDLSLVSESDQKAQELIALANALAQALELAPTPDSPDILNLLRAFLDILRQLDIDLLALQKGQAAEALQAKKISDTFSQQLQSRLSYLQQLSQHSTHSEWQIFNTFIKAFNDQ
jgi:hypothetical protein